MVKLNGNFLLSSPSFAFLSLLPTIFSLLLDFVALFYTAKQKIYTKIKTEVDKILLQITSYRSLLFVHTSFSDFS